MSISGLPTASATVLGAIKVGAGLSITAGVLAATGSPSPATTAALGSVIVPTAGNLTVDGSGNIGVPVAAAGTLGVVRVGTGLAIDGSGILSATGGTPPLATTTTAGTVIVPTAGNLTVDGSGNIGAPVAAAGTLGVVRVGSGLAIDGSGILSATGGGISPATTTTLGGVIVPTAGNLAVDGSGNISVPPATTGALGVVIVGNGLQVDSGGVISTEASVLPNFTNPKRFARWVGPNASSGNSLIVDLANNYVGQTNAWTNTTYGIGVNGADVDTDYAAATYKTIANLTGPGVLWHVIGPAIADAGDTVDIRLTVDGVATVISHAPGTINYRFGLGIIGRGPQWTSGNIGLGTKLDATKSAVLFNDYVAFMISPMLQRAGGAGGLYFDATLLVEIRVTSAQTSTTDNARRSGAIYNLEP